MADDRMAALDLLRKAATDGDLDFLREGLTMLSQLVMDVRLGGSGTITGSILLLAALVQSPYSLRFIYLSFGLAAAGVGLTLAILGGEWTLGSIRDARRSTGSLLRAIVAVPHEFLIALVGWLALGLGDLPAYLVQVLAKPAKDFPGENVEIEVIDARTGQFSVEFGHGPTPVLGTTCGKQP
jgi:hypothetical protein